MKDDAPDAVFVFVPSGQGAIFMKEFVERGLDKSGIELIGTGDVTDDDLLADIGDFGARRGDDASSFRSATSGKESVDREVVGVRYGGGV